MSTRFPLLEQMRADRQRREDEISAPYKREIEAGARMIDSLRRRLRAIEEALGRETGRMVGERFAHQITSKLMEIVQLAAMKATPWKPVTITLSPDIRFADPSSVESEIVRRYREQVLPRLSLRVDEIAKDYTTVFDIRVPELGYRQAVHR